MNGILESKNVCVASHIHQIKIHSGLPFTNYGNLWSSWLFDSQNLVYKIVGKKTKLNEIKILTVFLQNTRTHEFLQTKWKKFI